VEVGRPQLGPLLVGLGVAIALAGLLIWAGVFNWFGRLPGDVRIESGSTRIYFPIASCLVLSLALSAILYLVRRIFF
jgi:hypothetical protein